MLSHLGGRGYQVREDQASYGNGKNDFDPDSDFDLDKELSTLLAGNQLIPIVHNTMYGDLRNVSPMLASRTGLDTAEDSMAVVAKKIAELVAL
jgi:hypothetical protein